MPIGLREIAACPESLVAESIEHISQHILSLVACKPAVGHLIVGGLGIPKAEAVVMLARKHHVFHSSLLHHSCPLFRIELRRIEILAQSPIPLLVFLITHHWIGRNPVL